MLFSLYYIRLHLAAAYYMLTHFISMNYLSLHAYSLLHLIRCCMLNTCESIWFDAITYCAVHSYILQSILCCCMFFIVVTIPILLYFLYSSICYCMLLHAIASITIYCILLNAIAFEYIVLHCGKLFTIYQHVLLHVLMIYYVKLYMYPICLITFITCYHMLSLAPAFHYIRYHFIIFNYLLLHLIVICYMCCCILLCSGTVYHMALHVLAFCIWYCPRVHATLFDYIILYATTYYCVLLHDIPFNYVL